MDRLDQIDARMESMKQNAAEKMASEPKDEVDKLVIENVRQLISDVDVLLAIARAARRVRGTVIVRGTGPISPAWEKDFTYVAVEALPFDVLDLAFEAPEKLDSDSVDQTTSDHVIVRRSTPAVLCRCGRTMTEGDFNGHQIEEREKALAARGR